MTSDVLALTEDQQRAMERIEGWMPRGRGGEFYLGGYAGTGKTTLARRFMGQGVEYAAFTNKARKVLRSKGVRPASTLHSLLYQPYEIENDDGEVEVRFGYHPSDDLIEARLLVVDEASMVGRALFQDLRRATDAPILWLGDPAQLPPVKDTAVVTEPDYLMTEIVRQGAANPIVEVSIMVRNGQRIPFWEYENEVGSFRKRRRPRGVRDFCEAFCDDLLAADKILVGTHRTRKAIIRWMRRALGYGGPVPQPGERLMILTNDKDIGVFNGDEVVVEHIGYTGPEYFSATVVDESGLERILKIDHAGFVQEKPPGTSDFLLADYAYATTVHKAQGSEWPHVVVVDEWRWAHRQEWVYTAITRASERVDVFG